MGDGSGKREDGSRKRKGQVAGKYALAVSNRLAHNRVKGD